MLALHGTMIFHFAVMGEHYTCIYVQYICGS